MVWREKVSFNSRILYRWMGASITLFFGGHHKVTISTGLCYSCIHYYTFGRVRLQAQAKIHRIGEMIRSC